VQSRRRQRPDGDDAAADAPTDPAEVIAEEATTLWMDQV